MYIHRYLENSLKLFIIFFKDLVRTHTHHMLPTRVSISSTLVMNSSNFLESFVLGSAMLTLVAGNHAHLLPELGRTGNSLGNQFYTYTFMSPFFVQKLMLLWSILLFFSLQHIPEMTEQLLSSLALNDLNCKLSPLMIFASHTTSQEHSSDFDQEQHGKYIEWKRCIRVIQQISMSSNL